MGMIYIQAVQKNIFTKTLVEQYTGIKTVIIAPKTPRGLLNIVVLRKIKKYLYTIHLPISNNFKIVIIYFTNTVVQESLELIGDCLYNYSICYRIRFI